MFKKRKYIFGILLISCLFLITGCSIRKNVRSKEVKEFTKTILESNKKVKDLSFYFLRPYLAGELVYDGDLKKEDFEVLIDEFNKKIDIEFMQRIGDKYWGGSRPQEFILYIHVDKNKSDKDKHVYDYKITSDYNKTYRSDENPENIDGYETWYISDNDYRSIMIDGAEGETTDEWNVNLNAKNITPSGITLICSQSDEKPVENLKIEKYYHVQEKTENLWISVDPLDSGFDKSRTDDTLTIPQDGTLEWEINWSNLYGELPPGSYRIGIEIGTDIYDANIYYVNFEVKS